MKLQEAVKQLVQQFGTSVVAEVRLANLLADLNAYEEYPAMKQVFKEMQKAGFGRKLYDAVHVNRVQGQNISSQMMKLMAKEYNFKMDLVGYGFDCLLYGLGCINTVKEPIFKGYDPFSKGDEDLLNNLPGILTALQKEYLDSLDSLIILPKDLLQDAPGYYSADALTKLYAVEAKIAAVEQQLDANRGQSKKCNVWCKQQREQKLAHYKKIKDDAVEADRKQKLKIAQASLAELRQQYRTLLGGVVIPKKFGITRSGYFDETTLNQLSETEDIIKSLYAKQNKVYDDWCETEKTKVLKKYSVTSSNLAKQIALKIGIPAAVILGAVGTGTSYITSTDDIKQFEHTIEQGEQSASSGHYSQALQLFDTAKKNYHGSFRAGHYENVADEHIAGSVDAAMLSFNELIEQGKLLEANNLLQSLPYNLLSEDVQNVEKIRNAKAKLTTAMDDGFNRLISNISQNGGHLNAEGKKLLKELLSVTPDDYWLKFIKNKEQ